MKKRIWLGVTASVLAFLGFQAETVAQQAGQPAAPQRVAAPESEETIVITAEKREQNIQDVPVAVTAFTSAMRDKIGVTTVQDLASFTPGLSYQTGLDRIYVRGIGRSTNNQASDGGTAIYSDGVYTSSSYSAATPNIFVDRIEVLRGPQGTLYGRNAIGGAINVIARRPNSVLTGEVRGEVGAFNRYVAGGRISGPLSDQLRYSLSANHIDQGEGYFENVSGNESEGQNGYLSLIEGQLEADLTDNLSVWVRARSSLYDYSPRSTASLVPYSTLFVPTGNLVPSAQWAVTTGTTNGQAINIVFDGSPVYQNPTITTGDRRNFTANTFGHQTVKDAYDIATEVSWDIGDMNLKYIAGAVRYNYELTSDFDGTNVREFTVTTVDNPDCTLPGPATQCATLDATSFSLYGEDKRWWSHELNLSSTGDSAVQWLGGLYMYKEFYHQPLSFPVSSGPMTSPGITCMTIGCGVTALGGPAADSVYTTDVRGNGTSYAAFGQADWTFGEKWKLTGGLRYTHDAKDGVESTRQICYSFSAFGGLCPSVRNAGAFGGVNAYAGDVTGFLISAEQPRGATGVATRDPTTGFWSRGYEGSWNATTGTLGLQFEPDADTLVYAKFSRGYKAGGFNVGTINGGQIMTEPESVDAYEVGVKARPFSSLITNASVFYYNYKDRQTPLFIIPAFGPARTDFTNVPESKSIGVELETTWFATDNFRVMWNYAYLDATVEEGCCYIDSVDTLAVTAGSQPVGPPVGSNQVQDVAGQQLPNSPKHRTTINGIYTFDLPGGSAVDLSASYIWRDKAYAQFFNRDHHLIPAWDQVDLRAIWTDPSESYRVILFGRNVLDEEGYDLATATNRGSAAVPDIYKSYTLTPPRTWGVELQAKF